MASFLPDDLIVSIFRSMPLRDRILMRAINQRWYDCSEKSIRGEKSIINDNRNSAISQTHLSAAVVGGPHLEKIIWSPTSKSMNDIGNFIYPHIVSAKLRRLEINFLDSCDPIALDSMTGRMPNLERLSIGDLQNVSLTQFDSFIASCPNLKTLEIKSRHLSRFQFDTSVELFRRSNLASLTLDTETSAIEWLRNNDYFEKNDAFFINVGASFSALTELKIFSVNLSNVGVSALAQLSHLRLVDLRSPRSHQDDVNDGLQALAASCDRLEDVNVAWNIEPATLRLFIGWCPNLKYFGCYGLPTVDTAEAAAAIISSFSIHGRQRDTTVSFWDFIQFWKSDEALAALAAILDKSGHVIRFD